MVTIAMLFHSILPSIYKMKLAASHHWVRPADGIRSNRKSETAGENTKGRLIRGTIRKSVHDVSSHKRASTAMPTNTVKVVFFRTLKVVFCKTRNIKEY